MVKNRGLFSNTTSFHNSKNGQITIFIIIGIVILFVSAGILLISKQVVTENLDTAGDPIVQDAPQEFRAIQSFTTTCLETTAKKGLILLGEQGGYIYPNLVGKFSENKQTEKDGLQLSSSKIPYWHYNSKPSASSSVQFATLQPELFAKDDKEMSVESQLSRYVKENLNTCIGDYESFTAQGFETNAGEVGDVVVKIGIDTVNFWLKQDISVSIGDASHDMEQFYVKIPLRLKHYYDVAADLAQKERETTYLETIGLNLLQTYARADSSKLPPTDLFTFNTVSSQSWTTLDVQNKITEMLTSNIPLIRYQSSNQFFRYTFPQGNLQDLKQRTYDDMIIPLEKAQNLEVAFNYYAWEPYLDINEGEQTIKPKSYNIKSPLPVIPFSFNFQQYYNTYDLSYPVLVSLRDAKAFDNKGYTFNFALEANIVNNRPAEQSYTQPPVKINLKKTMVCDKDKRDTQLVRTIVVDSFTKEPLDFVKIGFNVPDQDFCEIGLTNTRGEVEEKYPAVFGGSMELIKDDYLTGIVPLNTYEYKEQPGIVGYAVSGLNKKVIELNRYKNVNIRVKKKTFEKCIKWHKEADLTSNDFLDPSVYTATGLGVIGGYALESVQNKVENGEEVCFSQGIFGPHDGERQLSYEPMMLDATHSWWFNDVAKNLDDQEEASIILQRVGDLNPFVNSDDFSTVITVSGQETTNVKLVPGVYKVTGFLIDKERITIPAEERCTAGVVESIACWDVNGCCFNYDKSEQNGFVSGQLEWDDESTYLTITPEMLYTTDEITLFMPALNIKGVPELPNIRILDDVQVASDLIDVAKTGPIRTALEAQFR